MGSQEFIKGIMRRCLWIEDDDVNEAMRSSFIANRLAAVRAMRLESERSLVERMQSGRIDFARFKEEASGTLSWFRKYTSESGRFSQSGFSHPTRSSSDNAFALYDAPSGTWP